MTGGAARRPGSGAGATARIPLTGFLVWGLLTFWAYTAIRLAAAWHAHVAARWVVMQARLDGESKADALAILQERGFSAGLLVPRLAAAALAASGVLVCVWFVHWIVIGGSDDYRAILGAVGASSLLFYAGTCALVLWLVRSVHDHEAAELLVAAFGCNALDDPAAAPNALSS